MVKNWFCSHLFVGLLKFLEHIGNLESSLRCLLAAYNRKVEKELKQSTYTYPDGEKYVGEFKDGERHGQGTYITARNQFFFSAVLSSRAGQSSPALQLQTMLWQPQMYGNPILDRPIPANAAACSYINGSNGGYQEGHFPVL